MWTLAPTHAKTEDQLAQVEVGDPPTREAYHGGLLARKQKGISSQRRFPEKQKKTLSETLVLDAGKQGAAHTALLLWGDFVPSCDIATCGRSTTAQVGFPET